MRKTHSIYRASDYEPNCSIELIGHDPEIKKISVVHFEWLSEQDAIESNVTAKGFFKFDQETSIYDQMAFYSNLFGERKLWFENLARYRLKHLMKQHVCFYLITLYIIAKYECGKEISMKVAACTIH